MGNTDISVNTLPDANTENTTEHSTIFDDVFRTIAQKMPQLLIPLINEVFHTSYSEKEPFEQLRNEHYEKFEDNGLRSKTGRETAENGNNVFCEQ